MQGTETEAAQAAAPARNLQIVTAADALLGEAGLEGLTIRAILNRTGLARRAFYEQFAGKDDLVLAVFTHTLRLAAQLFEAQVAALPDPIERLQHIVRGIVLGPAADDPNANWSNNRRGAALSREHRRLAEARPADLQAAIGPLVGLIARQLSDGIAAGQIRDANVHRTAMLIYNLISTTVHTELLAEGAAVTDRARMFEMADEIWEFCRRAVAA